MLSKAKKQKLVEEIARIVKENPSIVFTDFSGLTIGELDELKRELRAEGVLYKATKKSLWPFVQERAQMPEDTLGIGEYKGSIGIAYGSGEGIEASKILVKFAKKSEKLAILGGYINQMFFDKSRIMTLAALPSREELVAKLLYVLSSPMQRFVRAISAPSQQLVSVLSQIKSQK